MAERPYRWGIFGRFRGAIRQFGYRLAKIAPLLGMLLVYYTNRTPEARTKSIPTRRGISRTFWILASFSVFFWKSACHRLGPMDIFVKVHGISWNILEYNAIHSATSGRIYIPGYKIALFNMSYLINLIQAI